MADAYVKFFAGKVGPLKQAVEAGFRQTTYGSRSATPLLASNIEASAAYSSKDIAKGREFLILCPSMASSNATIFFWHQLLRS